MSHSVNEGQEKTLHIAWVTDNLEETVAWLAEFLGVETPPTAISPPFDQSQVHYLGKPQDLGYRRAYMMWGDVGFEVLEPDDRPSTWRDWLDRHGRGIHHIGIFVGDLDVTLKQFEGEGHENVQCANWNGGKYAFANTEPELGIMIELLQFT